MVYLLVFAYRRKELGNGFLFILNFDFEKWHPGLNSLEKEYKRLTKKFIFKITKCNNVRPSSVLNKFKRILFVIAITFYLTTKTTVFFPPMRI